MLVENLPVPFDRRVWMEATALRQAGYKVSVICPRGRYRRTHELLDGVNIYRYPLPSLGGLMGHVVEYSVALPATFALTLFVWMRHGFDVIHTANPPDIFFVIGLLFRPLGKLFIFDHHDLMPETAQTRWSGRKGRVIQRMLAWMERASFKTASIVIATNNSYRRVAMERGGVPEDRVFVVRSGPAKRLFQRGPAQAHLKQGHRFMVVYLGVMGPNDGVDYLLDAIAHVTLRRGRRDILFGLIGDGDMRAGLIRRAEKLGISPYIRFTGRLPDEDVLAYFSSADLGVAPDPKDALNDLCTMNKIVEYMATGTPVVAFDLTEARVSAAEAAVYVPANDACAFGEAILRLLANPELRERMGQVGRTRFENELAWDRQRDRLLAAYQSLEAQSD